MLSKYLAVRIIVLFIASTFIPMTIGYNVKTKNVEQKAEKYHFNRYLFPEYYDCLSVSERINYKYFTYDSNFYVSELKEIDFGNTPQVLDGPIGNE